MCIRDSCKMFNGTSTNQKTLCSQAIASLKKVSRMEENYEVTLKKVPDGLKIDVYKRQVFEEVLDFLKKANCTKNTVRKILEEIEKEEKKN